MTLGYGARGSIEDAFGLVKTVAIEGESGNKVDYTRGGLRRFVKIAHPQPGVELSMIRPGGGSEGDSGDPYVSVKPSAVRQHSEIPFASPTPPV